MYRYGDENDYEEDLDEEYRTAHINLDRFGQRNGNREVIYGDTIDNNLEDIKLKISSFQGKEDEISI